MPANPSTPEVTRAQSDSAFLHELAERLFRTAAPTIGFDQNDTDQLHRIARDLEVHATPARGGDELREALEEIAGLPHGLDIGYAGDIARAALASTDMAGAGEGNSRPTSPLGHARACLRTAGETSHVQIRRVDLQWIIDRFPVCDPDAPPVEGLTSGEGWQLVPVGDPVTLNQCPPGPFTFNGSLGFKTEYGAAKWLPERDAFTVSHWPDPYCLDSGEAFWGGVSGQEARAALIVQPLAASPKATATASVREAVEAHARWLDEIGTNTDMAEIVADGGVTAGMVVQQEAREQRRRLLRALTDSGTADTHAGSGDTRYLVWSNEHKAWWGPDHRGYTRHIERAGRYDRAEALKIAGTRDGGWRLNKGNPDEIAIPEQDAIDQYADITAAQAAALHPVDSRAQGGEKA